MKYKVYARAPMGVSERWFKDNVLKPRTKYFKSRDNAFEYYRKIKFCKKAELYEVRMEKIETKIVSIRVLVPIQRKKFDIEVEK